MILGTFEINSVDAVAGLIHEAYCRYQKTKKKDLTGGKQNEHE